MASIREQMGLFKNKKTDKLTSGFDVDTSIAASIINESAFIPKQIPYEKLAVSPYNTYEYNQDEIAELKESILRLGVLDYLIVEMISVDRYEILSGQKRYIAITEIKEQQPDAFAVLFPKSVIPCRVVDFRKFSLFNMNGAEDLCTETKRMFIIASGNQQHEKTVRDYMTQIEQLSTVYAELKEKGYEVGTRAREFMARYAGIQTRSVQKVINAKRDMYPPLWDRLKIYPGLTSVTTLEGVANLPEMTQKSVLTMIENGEDVILADVIKAQKALDKTTEPVFVPAAAGSAEQKSVSREELRSYLAYRRYEDVAASFPESAEVETADIEEIKKIGKKIARLCGRAERLLKKYEP